MIERTYILSDDVELTYRPPPTAADVLDWTLWIQCMGAGTLDGTAQVVEQGGAALKWACQWIEGWEPDALTVLLLEVVDEPASYMGALVDLCNEIANSAGLPESVLGDLSTLLDAKNGVPEDYKPESACTCTRCRRGIDNPRGVVCMYDGVDQRAVLAAARVSAVTDTSERYYIAQVRGVLARAESRRITYERNEAAEREEYQAIMRRAGVMRG